MAADATHGTGGVWPGTWRAATAYLLVGSLAGVNAAIGGYPVFGAQALRYTLASAVLAAACLVQRRRGLLPRLTGRLTGREIALLTVQATFGVTGFNFCAAEAVRHTGAATVGTVIAAVPVVLAIAGPLAARRRPAKRVILAAALVTAGAAVVTGLGGTNLTGLLLAFGALAAEICFTLVAVPLLPRFGPLRLSAYVSGLAVPVLFAFSFATGGRGALPVPTAGEAAAICYLAVAVGAGGFYFLYSALSRLGADRVGLYAGLVPFGAMGAALVLGAGTVGPADIAGAILVAAGVAAGAGARPSQRRAAPPGRRSEERATREGSALRARRRREASRERATREGSASKRAGGERQITRRRRSSAGRGRGHRGLSIHRADGGTARRDAAA
jgi:drug/metabolite transporter (DMT)-like permease